MDFLMGCSLFVLALVVILNRSKITRTADSWGILLHESSLDCELRMMKKAMNLDIQLLKNRVEHLESKEKRPVVPTSK